MSRRAVVAGVGMIPFTTPSRSETYDVMGTRAARAALLDAGVEYAQIRQAYAGYVYGDSTCGQAVIYGLGQTGIPVINVNNNCSTGSSALFLARQAVASGAAEAVLAVGFEQMQRGALARGYADRPSPFARFDEVMDEIQERDESPFAAQMFGGAGRQYAQRYGTSAETFAKISVKSRRHAANNPYAVFKDPLTVAEAGWHPRTSAWSSCTTASPPTNCSPTRRSGSPRRARRKSSSTTATTPTAAGW